MKTGGSEKIIPLYKEQKNTPFIPNEQKEIYRNRLNEQRPQLPPQQSIIDPKNPPMVNLQVYQPTKPKDKPNDPSAFIASTVPTFNLPYLPQQFSQQLTNPINIIKNYQINTIGPQVDHTKVSYIFEDVLPVKNISNIPTTISERLTIFNYIRSIMFNRGDGTQVNLDGKNTNTNDLLSHLKLMDLNPYNTFKFSNNPYKGLPNGFLLYRCCYPIRHESINSSVSCAINSMGANVRIYKLVNAAYQVNKQQNNKLMDFEVWRDIAYFEYIREHILKKKESPNFILLYGYYLNENSKIDFDKITLIKGDKLDNEHEYIKQDISKEKLPDFQPINMKILDKANKLNKLNPNNNHNTYIQNPNAYTGKILVALTEAPLYNLYNWSSKIYQAEGNIRRMINTGFYSDKVWYSILFQMMVILYCLQIHEIIFNNFDIENNIYIKDINPHSNVTNFWKYKIDGIDYYIPNYGYLVLFDSSYKDINKNVDLINKNNNNNIKTYKISGKIFEDNILEKDVKIRTFNQFKKTFNNNIFSRSFIDMGGVKPSPEILRFINNIMDYSIRDNDLDIGLYFYKFMRQFMNNRIGTYLKETEVLSIRKNDIKDFTKGNIIVYEEAADTYKFVLFYGQTSNGVYRILNKDFKTNDIIEMDVAISVLYQYSKVEPIIQNFKINESNLNEDELLETYILNK